MIVSLTAFGGVRGFSSVRQVIITTRRATLSTTSVIRSTAEAASTSAASASSTDDETSPTTISKTVKSDYDYSKLKMEDVVSLCKRRGIIFPSSEIYNGFAGFFDYGPLGVELKKNIKDAFWTDFVRLREDIVGLDSSIIHNPLTWKSSGHLDGFSDPMVDCRETKLRYRADQLYTSPVVAIVVKGDDDKEEEEEVVLGYVTVMEGNDEDMQKSAEIQAKKLLKEKEMKKDTKLKPFNFIDLTQVTEEIMAQVPSPGSGKPTLTMPRDFNLMFSTSVGAMQDASSVAYLRPETAQGIFINYKNVLGSSRLKLPFGIAQIGKAFRNEITPRNFIFRSREFEQMEIEYFIPPGDEDVWGPYHQRWIADARSFLEGVGLRSELLGYDVHSGDGLAHYARACTDITFHFPFGVQELMGIAARGDYDLKSHSEGSGKGKKYFVMFVLCLSWFNLVFLPPSPNLSLINAYSSLPFAFSS
jgi:glycyl-tRNA synthetase